MGNAYPQERAASSSRYTILGRLASGGMADIYLVLASTEAGVERYLVLKRVLAERARDPAFAEMFLDEARLAAQLQHQNIAQVYDVGKLDGTYFFTMEYVHGEDIHAVLHKLGKQKASLPVNLALYVATGALAALHHAHDRTTPDGTPLGVVHRDVSPSNIMVSYEGAIKLLDFGVAKASQRTTQSQSGSIKGKVAYLSPEQIQSKNIDRRSDIFSLGICLYEMLTGRRLFKREADFQAMMAIVTEDIAPPSRQRPDLSPEIDRIVMTALAKDRDQRYPSAAAMLEDIEAVASAERYMLSATAMGRFMKELFGTKPEPWIELRRSEVSAKPVTVTNLSGVVPAPLLDSGSAGVGAIDELGPQLERAPDLRAFARATPTSMPIAEPSGSGARPAPSMPSMPSMPISLRRSRAVPITVATLVTIGLAVAGFVIWQEQTKHETEPAENTQQMSATPPQQADASIEVVTAQAPDAATPLAGSDVAVAVAVAAEPVPPVADPEPSATTEPIAVTPADPCVGNVLPADRKQCGIAACDRKARAVALVHHREAARVDQLAIERACQAKGITLVRAPVQRAKPKPRPDSCADPAYLKANPLKCP